MLCYRINFTKSRILSLVKAIIATVLATAIFTVPFLSEEAYQKYGVPDPVVLKGLDLSKLIQFSLDNTSYRAIEGNVYNIGLVMIVALFVGIIAFKKFNRSMRAIYLIFVVTFLLSTKVFPWHLLQNTPIQVIQYPFRILLFASLFGSVIAAKEITLAFKVSFDKYFAGVAVLTAVIAGGLWYSSISNTYPGTLLSKPQLVIDSEMIDSGKIPDSYLEQYVPLSAQKNLDQVAKHVVEINGHESAQIPRTAYNGNFFTFKHIKRATKSICHILSINIPRHIFMVVKCR